MHDISSQALATRLDLPSKDLVLKGKAVDGRLIPQVMSSHHRDSPQVITTTHPDPKKDFDPVLEVGPEKEDTPEGPDIDKNNTKIVTISQLPGTPQTPQPVTPDPPKSVEGSSRNENALDSGILNKDVVKPTPASAPPAIKKNLHNLTFKSSARPNRGRIVSLDRAREVTGMDGYQSSDTSPATDDERYRRAGSNRNAGHFRRNDHHGNDSSSASSDDDSSYFATHLPSPKSGRSFSYSSTGSAPARTSFYQNGLPRESDASSYYQNSVTKESDASLSFSDESDEDLHQNVGVHISPMVTPKGVVGGINLYPQRITRMHSVSSLVSSASSDDGMVAQMRRASIGSASSHASTATSSDPSARAELRNLVSMQDNRESGLLVEGASGRRSPIMGQAPGNPNMFFSSPSPGMMQPSPPTIMQGYVPPPGMPHPQPQPMTSDQMAAWVTAGNAAAQLYQPAPQQPQGSYGAISNSGGFRNSSDQSQMTLPFVYSEDEDTDEGVLINQLSGNGAGVRQAASGPIGAGGTASGDARGNPINGNGGARPGQPGSGGGQGKPGASSFGKKDLVATSAGGGDSGGVDDGRAADGSFKVYWQRWIMLMYMSVLNLLSDWTCYSVAPIAILTKEAFGEIDPEQLVVIFLGANAVASACEPIILARLGLRRTVLFGALLLMIGSVIKSGGLPPLMKSDLVKGHDEFRLYLGFFLVGLSQPLYQCTPALLSASWFPERERTMATGVALNANQLGIGFAFIFGTILVGNSDDIPNYFGLLSIISTITFMGTLIQFDDAPPTPPSDSARVMRGTLEVNLPSVNAILNSVRGFGDDTDGMGQNANAAAAPSPAPSTDVGGIVESDRNYRKKDSGRGGSRRRKKTSSSKSHKLDSDIAIAAAPSPMMPGRVGQPGSQPDGEESPLYDDGADYGQEQFGLQAAQSNPGDAPPQPGHPPMGMPYGPPGAPPPYGAYPPPHYQYPYWDPRMQQQMPPDQQGQAQGQGQGYYPMRYNYYQPPPVPPEQYQYYYQPPPPPHGYYYPPSALPAPSNIEGAEPVVTITPHHLDIDIRDDQIILSLRACLSRPGFVHALVAFTVSGIVINTLSTFMEYLVTLNGAPRYFVGVVGGSFQFVIMISSLIIGKQTDKTRAYYSVTIGMLVMGAFGLAECGVSLDADRGSDLRWSLVVVAALVGPLQPVSTELGVDVAYPLSENTVLVIQQLFSNLLSALFIPFFKSLKDVGTQTIDDTEMYERPEYTFSFYLLIVLHAAATVFFATFNGRYLRFEHELRKKAEEERRQAEEAGETAQAGYDETQPLVNRPVV